MQTKFSKSIKTGYAPYSPTLKGVLLINSFTHICAFKSKYSNKINISDEEK